MRHPGYGGALLAYVATPLLLDSTLALIPVALLSINLVIRTALEDRTLQAELEAHRNYARRVK